MENNNNITVKTKIYLCIGFVIFLILCVLLYKTYGPQKEYDIITNSGPVEKEYGIFIDNVIYSEDNFHWEYGHIEDLYGEILEEVKVDYLEEFDCSNLVFPNISDAAYHFPAFVLYESTQYTEIPEDVLRTYFVDELVDPIIQFREEGYETCVNGISYDVYMDDPGFEAINVEVLVRDKEYLVETVVNEHYKYIQHFYVDNDGRLGIKER